MAEGMCNAHSKQQNCILKVSYDTVMQSQLPCFSTSSITIYPKKGNKPFQEMDLFPPSGTSLHQLLTGMSLTSSELFAVTEQPFT